MMWYVMLGLFVMTGVMYIVLRVFQTLQEADEHNEHSTEER